MSAICVHTTSQTLPEIADRLADCVLWYNSTQIFTSADFSSGLRIEVTEVLQHRPPNMIVKRIHVRTVWRPEVFVNEIWTVSCMQVTVESLLLENKLLAKQDLFTKQNDVIVTSLFSWYSVVFSICKQDFDR